MILAELAESLGGSPPKTIEDLWRWMAQENPVFAKVRTPYGQDELLEGVRLLPSPTAPSPLKGESKEGANFRSSRGGGPNGYLELLLMDWTFGTEELSSYSPFVQKVEKNPCLFMQAQDASRLGLRDKDEIRISLDGGSLDIQLAVVENMATGITFLPRHRQLNWRIFKELPAKIPVERIKKI